MFLKEIKLTNFRPFKEAVFPLPPAGIVLVVGANNSGKTSLLAGLDVVAGRPVSGALRRVGAGGPAEVRATFELAENEREALLQSLIQGDAADATAMDTWMGTEALREIEWCFTDERGVGMELTRLSVLLPVGMRPIAVMARGAVQIAPLAQVLRLGKPAVALELQRSVTGNLPQDYLLVNTPGEISGLLAVWRSNSFHFASQRPGTQSQRPIDSAPALDHTGANLPEALLYLRTNHSEEWDDIRGVMSAVVPEVGTLETPTSQGQISIAFLDPYLGQHQNLKDLGTGVEQLLLAAYVGVHFGRTARNATIIIEEIEANLHPGAQRALYAYLTGWSKTSLFILSSHSTLFLDHAARHSSGWLVEREKGLSMLLPLGQDLGKGLESLGVRLSDVLSSERLLLVEGPTDIGPLMAWFPALGAKAEVAVVASGGGDSAGYVSMVETALKAADTLHRPVLFLRDRDEMTTDAVEKLERGRPIHVLRRRELENYFLDDPNAIADQIASVLKTSRSPKGPPQPEAFATLLREAADRARPIAVLRRVAARFSPQRLVARKEIRGLSPPDLPSLAALLQHKTQEVGASLGGLAQLWAETEREVETAWDANWNAIVPGEEVLSDVFKQFGLTFDKDRDGLGIARRMKPPTELQEVVARFLTPGRRESPG